MNTYSDKHAITFPDGPTAPEEGDYKHHASYHNGAYGGQLEYSRVFEYVDHIRHSELYCHAKSYERYTGELKSIIKFDIKYKNNVSYNNKEGYNY